MTARSTHPSTFTAWALVPVAVAAVLVATIWLRFTGPWAETDTVTVTRTIRGVLNAATVEPPDLAYSNGFNYPTLAAIVVDVTGLPARTVQTMVLPWLLPVTALAAFVAFRAITGSPRIGAVCALLPLIQADFLFVTQRGSHEKITWMFVLVLLFALVRSLQQRSIGRIAPFIGIVYLVGFAITCTNVFFASTLITMLGISLAIGLVSARWILRDKGTRRILLRLAYAVLTLGILTYLFMTVLYPTAQSNFEELKSAADKIAVFYLGAETKSETVDPTGSTQEAGGQAADPAPASAPTTQTVTAASPYRTIANVWVSRDVFLVLTAFTWILLIYAAISWVLVALRFLHAGVTRDEIPLFLIWTLSAAAASQIAGSIAADFLGIFGGNLQLRLFPAFTVFAIPLVVLTLRLPLQPVRSRTYRWLLPALGVVGFSAVATAFPAYGLFTVPFILAAVHFFGRAQVSGHLRTAAIGFGIVAFVGFALAATLKATNDPLVSNRWIFYSQAEEQAIRWGNANLPGRRVWTEFDERLAMAGVLLNSDRDPFSTGGARWTKGISAFSDETVPYILVSDVTVDRALRTRNPAPDVRKEDVIYDNGDVRFAHRIPDTPYQP